MKIREKLAALDFLSISIAVIGLWFFMALTNNLCSVFLLDYYAINSVQDLLKEIGQGNLGQNVFLLRMLGGLSNFFTYLLPSLVFIYWFNGKDWKKSFFLDKMPAIRSLGLAIAIIFASAYFINAIYYYNTILIPETWIAKDILGLEKIMMQMNSWIDLGLNILVFGVIAGVGEELFFRGIIQKKISYYFKNIHLGAVLTGLFFTLSHFQLEGFLPRFILSLFFSYFLIYTANLWITILIHMIFNSAQVFLLYFNPESVSNVDKVIVVSLTYALFSLLCTVFLWITFVKMNQNTLYKNRIYNLK